MRDTFQAQVYDDEIRQSELSYKIAKYRLYPHLDLALGFGQQNQSQVNGNSVSHNQVFSDTAGVGVSWSIFDGYATRGAKLAALTSKRVAERERQTYLDQTLEQARESERQSSSFPPGPWPLRSGAFNSTKKLCNGPRIISSCTLLSQAGLDQATGWFPPGASRDLYARADFLSSWSGYLSLLNVDPVLNNLPDPFFQQCQINPSFPVAGSL